METAFKKLNPNYRGLDTSNNKVMHPYSERFASYLLMPTAATRRILAVSGFDMLLFAQERHRSLASVVVRAKTLFPARSESEAPAAGLWLFEGSWDAAPGSELWLTQQAHLGGFSTDKSKPAGLLASSVFPGKDAGSSDFPMVDRAAGMRLTEAVHLTGMGLFDEDDFLVIAEPVLSPGFVRQVLMTAIRRDSWVLVQPWIQRTRIRRIGDAFQSLRR